MNKRVMFGVLAALLLPVCASAQPEPRLAEIAPQILNEIQQKMVVPAGAPVRWQTIVLYNGVDMDLQTWERKGATVKEDRAMFLFSGKREIYDPLGLVELAEDFDNIHNYVAAIAISQKIDTSQPVISASVSLTSNQSNGQSKGQLTLSGSPAELQIAFQKIEASSVSFQFLEAMVPKPGYRGYQSDGESNFSFDPRFDIFIPSNETVLDWRFADQPWHSQQVSAALTPAQQQQARSLFARAFDLFKAGDFTGARALIEAGQKIDPGNYLGWFTLGEIGRSMAVTENTNRFGTGHSLQRVAYQHTIDLAPDSPEAALAKGYLAALH